MRYLEPHLPLLHQSGIDVLTCPGIGLFQDTAVPGYRMFYDCVGQNPPVTHHELMAFRHSDIMWLDAEPAAALGVVHPDPCREAAHRPLHEVFKSLRPTSVPQHFDELGREGGQYSCPTPC